MVAKFNKYWDRCNFTLAIAYVLNPRYKMKFVENYYIDIYGEADGAEYTRRVASALASLYKKYALQKTTSEFTPSSSSTSSLGDRMSSTSSSIDITTSKSQRMEIWYQRAGIATMDSKSDLDIYLEEPLKRAENLDVLGWWRTNSATYPIVSKMARDILAIPAFSVPSESAFSTSSRVLNDHRASLSPKTVEALLCTQCCLPSLSGAGPVGGNDDCIPHINN